MIRKHSSEVKSEQSDVAEPVRPNEGNGYEYEWADADFFDPSPQNQDQKIVSPTTPTEDNWRFNARIERFVLLEVAWGHHQYVEMTAGDIIKACVGQLTYRDLKQVFSSGQKPASFEIRQNCIVLSMPPITALIFHDRCVFHINPYLDTDRLLTKLKEITQAFSYKAEETRAFFMKSVPTAATSNNQTTCTEASASFQHGMIFTPSVGLGGSNATVSDHESHQNPRFVQFPLEFALLEIFLSYVVESLENELFRIETDVTDATDKFFSEHPKGDTLHKLHTLKEPLETYVDKITNLSQTFEDLLESSEDLYSMELTKLYYRPDTYDVEEDDLNPNLEIMLEFFDQEIDQLKRRANKLERLVLNVERHINLKLSLMRSKLHVIDIVSSILSVGIAAGNGISGAFGMNLRNGLEESKKAFIISVVSIAALALLSALIAWKFKLRFT